jgi:hypothetical protein
MSGRVWALFSTWVTPTVMVQRGDVWDASDPVVTSHPDWFTADPEAHGFVKGSGETPEPVTPERAPDVESATAAPGERRTRTRGRPA